MSEKMLFKPQQEWLDHFGELAKKHGEMLAQPFVEFFADKILLTKKEVEEARAKTLEHTTQVYGCFLRYANVCNFTRTSQFCRLCKKLTQFAEEERDEGIRNI